MSDIETVSSGSNGAARIRFRSRRAARQVSRGARQAHPRRRQRTIRRSEGRLQPLRRRSLRRSRLHPRAAERRGRRRDHRRRLRRAAGGCASARGGREGHPHDRERRRLRRHLVLEPLSRRAVRYRVVHLSAAARGDRLHPEGEVLLRAGDPRARAAHRREVRSLSRRLLSDADQGDHLERRRVPMDRHHQSRRPACARASSSCPTGR